MKTFRSFSLFCTLSGLAAAQPASFSGDDHPLHLDNFVVTASPLARAPDEISSPTSVLAGPALAQRLQPSLGETLAGLPGVDSTWFGPGASRPVIRGLGGDRIRVLTGGVGTIDASVVSPDHAVSLDPLLIDRIEIVRGPASLLYGGGAVGGVVNVIDGRIPETLPPAPLTGRLELRGDTASGERAGAAVFSGTAGRFAWRIDGFRRSSDDLRIPGYAETEALRAAEAAEHGETLEEHDAELARGRLPNTATETTGASLGLSYIGESGHLGFAYSGYNTLYGVPGHEHGGHHDEEEHETGEEHGEEGVRIDLRQRRLDVQGETTQAFGPFSGARVKFGSADYTHRELEGDEVGTTFHNRGYDGRAELLHSDLGGLAGAWGVQAGRSELAAIGAEAFLPTARSRTAAVFAFEEFKAGAFTPQFGARVERQSIDVRDGSGRGRDDNALSLSAGTVWNLAPDWTLGVSLTRTERAPNAQELYADGPHIGTGAYEIGDAGLAREKSLGVELNLRRRAGFVTGELSLFANKFQGFIYEQPTGEVAVAHDDHFHFEDPADLHGHEGDGALTVYRYAATDADFYGAEAEVVFHLRDTAVQQFDLRLAADFTRAEDGDGRPLPRIPAARYTVGLDWRRGPWRADVEWQSTAEQNRVAPNEESSDGYGLLGAGLAWARPGLRGVELFVRGTNLTDEEARPHTSFLKDLAPLPGRNVSAGVRWRF